MSLDLFLRVRRDRFNLAVRLRLLAGAGAAVIVPVVILFAGAERGPPVDASRLPLIIIAPPSAYVVPPPA